VNSCVTILGYLNFNTLHLPIGSSDRLNCVIVLNIHYYRSFSKSRVGRNSNSHYKNWFFESQPLVGFQKTDFCVFSAAGAENTKIGFIMRIAGGTKPHSTF